MIRRRPSLLQHLITRRRGPGPNHTLEMLGLLPFLLIAILMASIVAVLVLVTGVVYHSYDTTCTKIIDVSCIVVLTIYVNIITTWRPTPYITLAVAVVALLNSRHTLWPVHVFLVQAPLALCLFFFEKGRQSS